MKKLFTLSAALMLAAVTSAQVTVTYQVDITDYLANGATLDPTGIRAAGNFGDNGAVLGGTTTAVSNWAPTDSTSAMTDLGNNVWSFTVDYPAGSVGMTQNWKFVNGNWGTNEGAATLTDCGVDDGFGGFNRAFEIPAASGTYRWCWDACFQCDGSEPMMSFQSELVKGLRVYPNPAVSEASVSFSAAGVNQVQVRLFDLSGRELVKNDVSGNGNFETVLNVSGLNSGMYVYHISNGAEVLATGRLLKK